MKKILLTFCVALVLLFSLAQGVHAYSYNANHWTIAQYLDDYLVPDGGWIIEDDLGISAFKSAKKYSINLEKGLIPDSKILDTVTVPIDSPDYIARGRFVCFRKNIGFPDRPIVVLLHSNKPEKAWVANNSKLNQIAIKEVVCKLEDEE